jgi:hypothetical protein
MQWPSYVSRSETLVGSAYPRVLPFVRSVSRADAIANASGLISTTAQSVELTSLIRPMYV